jgi:hypothetical protein
MGNLGKGGASARPARTIYFFLALVFLAVFFFADDFFFAIWMFLLLG